MDRVVSSLDVVGTTGGKVTVETIRQAAPPWAAATEGAQGHQAAALKAARTRKRKAGRIKRFGTLKPEISTLRTRYGHGVDRCHRLLTRSRCDTVSRS